MSKRVDNEIDGVVYHDEIDDATLEEWKQQAEEEKEEEQKKTKKTKKKGAKPQLIMEPDEVALYAMAHIATARVQRETVTEEEVDKVMTQTRQEAHDIMVVVGEEEKKTRREAMEADGKAAAEIAQMEQEVDDETARKIKTAESVCDGIATELHRLRQASEGEAFTLTREMLKDAPTVIKANWTYKCDEALGKYVEWCGEWEKRQRREDAQEAQAYLQDYSRCGETQLQEIVTDVLIEQMHNDGKNITNVDAVEFRHEYLRLINGYITVRNASMSALVTAKMAKGSDLESICKDIPAAALAKLLIDAKIVRHMRYRGPGGEDVDILALRGIKPSDKKRYGIYALVDLYGKRKETTPFALLCSRLNPHADDKYRKKVQSALLIALEPETEFRCPGVVPVRDGVFIKHADVAAKMIARMYPDRPKALAEELTDWTLYKWGDKHIDDLLFLRKIQTPYGEKKYEAGEKQPTLKAPKMPGGTFDVDEWWLTLYDIYGPEEAQRLVDVDKRWVAAVVDYSHRMTAGMFYVNENHTGNNGKGARATMICTMIGDTNYQSASLNDLGGQFGGAGVENVLYMTMSELTYSDGVGSVDMIKSIITRDPVKVERKYQDSYTVEPLARIEVQTNEYPNIPDKTGSFYRRWIYMPANKHFGEGTEIPEIKSEYLVDPIVSQHLLRQVLHIDLDGFGVEGGDWETETMKACRERYKVEVDPVRRFLEENLLPEPETGKFRSQWTAYPYALLHAAYLKELQMQGLSGRSAIGLTKFKQRAAEWAEGSGYYRATDERLRTGKQDKYHWSTYQPFFRTYDLPQFRYNDPVLTRLNRPEIYTMSPERFDGGFYGGLLLKDNIKAMPIRKATDGKKTAEDKAKDLLSGLSTEERAALLAMLTQKEDVV